MNYSNIVCVAVLGLGLASSARAQQFIPTYLVTDNQSASAAQITDSGSTNSWGISLSATSPFWVSANGSGVANVYTVNATTNVTSKNGITVSIPGDGSVTGQVNNSNSAAFNADNFLFVSEDGTISGWRGALGTMGTAETFVMASTANVYKGVAEVTSGTTSYLYAANFRNDSIDVLSVVNSAVTTPILTGNFADPNIPAGYAPFNIQNLGGNLYVTYALQDAAKHDDVAGPGHGFVDVFDTEGNLLKRVASQGTLNSPWGLAIAPSSFGSFAGDLLVGNFGDGTINAFNLSNDSFVGQLQGTGGQPLSIDGLWGLTVGNDHSGGSSSKLYFAAGPNNESNGLFGVISPVPEPSTLALLAVGAMGFVAFGRRRRRQAG